MPQTPAGDFVETRARHAFPPPVLHSMPKTAKSSDGFAALPRKSVAYDAPEAYLPQPSLLPVQEGRVIMTDGNHYFNRPGPRVVESAEILAEFLHPGRFDFGSYGHGWQYWENA